MSLIFCLRGFPGHLDIFIILIASKVWVILGLLLKEYSNDYVRLIPTSFIDYDQKTLVEFCSCLRECTQLTN